MIEEDYQAIYDRAKAYLEQIGKPNLLDILRPVQPGVVAARAAFEPFGLTLRMLSCTDADTSFDFLGRKLKSPIMTASLGFAAVNNVRPDGFRMILEGARRCGAQCWVGDCDDDAWKDLAKLAPSLVRVVKPWKDEDRILRSLAVAEETGALAVGVDFEAAYRTAGCEPKSPRALASYVKATRLPFIVKGVGSLQSARVARDTGAAAIVVSTHGGAVGPAWGHPLETLPEIVSGMGDHLLVLAESGVRRGEDILKLLARGARGVVVGRVLLLGLAADGADGVAEILRVLNEDLKECMVMAGCPSLSSIGEDILVRR